MVIDALIGPDEFTLMEESRAPQLKLLGTWKLRDRATALVLGNGPSLAEMDLPALDGLATFGLNAAYRFWETIDWRPSHYVCLDSVVGLSHKDAIAELIEENRISAFLLRENLIEELGDLAEDLRVTNFDQLARRDMMYSNFVVTTGAGAALWAAGLGYRRIILAGVDGAYTELVGGAKRNQGSELEIVTAENNPNYFFQGYQLPGDRYQIPNPKPGLHLQSWRTADALISKFSDAHVYNGNPNSEVRIFPFVDLNQVLRSTPQGSADETGSGKIGRSKLPASQADSLGAVGPDEVIFLKAQLKQAIGELKRAHDDLRELKDRASKPSVSKDVRLAFAEKTVSHVDMTSFVHCIGWHHAEPHGRWMGPSNEGIVLIPSIPNRPCTIKLRIVSAMSPDILLSLGAWLDGQVLDLKLTEEPRTSFVSGITRLLRRLLRRPLAYPVISSAALPIAALNRNETGHVLKLRVSKTQSPVDSGEPDTRQMSVCVRNISIVED